MTMLSPPHDWKKPAPWSIPKEPDATNREEVIMLANTIVLKNLDPVSLHHQILQLEAMQREMAPDDSIEADTVKQTVKLLHTIEEELRRQARAMHQH
jgi:hypothetical protein